MTIIKLPLFYSEPDHRMTGTCYQIRHGRHCDSFPTVERLSDGAEESERLSPTPASDKPEQHWVLHNRLVLRCRTSGSLLRRIVAWIHDSRKNLEQDQINVWQTLTSKAWHGNCSQHKRRTRWSRFFPLRAPASISTLRMPWKRPSSGFAQLRATELSAARLVTPTRP